jgi:hypothetical protein
MAPVTDELQPSLPVVATGYALPFPARLAASDPDLIGERGIITRTTSAGPVRLNPVPGTPVDAVTAGTTRVIRGGHGIATVV